jgi:RNA-binding protein NOB1
MASWAAIAKAAPALAPEAPEDENKDATIAVVDANAIINGLRLESIADKAVTIQEVLAEIRDKQSRQFLEMLPFGIEVREPSDESVKISEPPRALPLRGCRAAEAAAAAPAPATMPAPAAP